MYQASRLEVAHFEIDRQMQTLLKQCGTLHVTNGVHCWPIPELPVVSN